MGHLPSKRFEFVPEYASAEKCIQPDNEGKFVPSYITYVSERAMDNIQLQDPL